MELTIIFAKFWGSLFMILGGVSVVAGFLKRVINYTEDRAIIVSTGYITFLLGLMTVVAHNMWVWDWPVVITILGWVTLFKGLEKIIFPERVNKKAQMFKSHSAVWGAVIFLIGVFIFWIGLMPISNNNRLVGGDKDEHGCIGSAGYSWCEPKEKCLRIWEEQCFASVQQEIQYILAGKYNKPVGEVNVNIVKQTENHASGGVKFGPASSAGGLFLAVLSGNQWEVVYDGNGSIDCEKMRSEYNFPDDILKPNFCD